MIEEIREKLGAIQKGSKMVGDLLRSYENLKKKKIANPYKLEELVSKIEKSINLYPIEGIKEMIVDWVKEERSFIERLKEEFTSQFANELSRLLREKGFELRGQCPNLYSGLYTIKLEFGLGRARIGWGPEPISTTRLAPEDVVECIDRFEKMLKGRRFDPDDFASRLLEAYRRRLTLEGKADGEKVCLVDVLNELVFLQQDRGFRADPTKAKFKGYGRCMFGYDLSRLKKMGARSMKLYTATFDSTRFRDKVIFVPEGEGGTRYGYISFED
jgi:hypothetical protein